MLAPRPNYSFWLDYELNTGKKTFYPYVRDGRLTVLAHSPDMRKTWARIHIEDKVFHFKDEDILNMGFNLS